MGRLTSLYFYWRKTPLPPLSSSHGGVEGILPRKESLSPRVRWGLCGWSGRSPNWGPRLHNPRVFGLYYIVLYPDFHGPSIKSSKGRGWFEKSHTDVLLRIFCQGVYPLQIGGGGLCGRNGVVVLVESMSMHSRWMCVPLPYLCLCIILQYVCVCACVLVSLCKRGYTGWVGGDSSRDTQNHT